MASPTPLQQSPLRADHLQLGGKLVPFAGWELPVQFEGVLPEHKAVRERVGAFDISHMGQFFARGTRVAEVLGRILSNDFGKLEPGQAQYSMLLTEDGGVIDDLFVYRLADDEALLVVNAARIDEDWERLTSLVGDELELENASADYAGIAVQGPESVALFETLDAGVLPGRHQVAELPGGGYVCRTGYTGEDGFELFVPASEGPSWWRRALASGAAPCGLGARDSLRLEVCYPLNGNDLDMDHTPLEAGLGFAVSLGGRTFPGSEVLRAQKRDGLGRKLVALQVTGKGAPPRPGYPVMAGEQPVGVVASGGFGPSVGRGIAMAYLPADLTRTGTALELDIRGRRVPVEVVTKPFYRRG